MRSLLVRALEDKLRRTVDRIYLLLGLIYPWKDVAAARYTIEHSEARAPAPSSAGQPAGRRGSEACDADHRRFHYGREARQANILEAVRAISRVRWRSSFTTKIRSSQPPRFILRSNGRMLAGSQTARVGIVGSGRSRRLADRMREIPLFDFASVDELIRIAGTGRQMRHESGRELFHEGFAPDDVHFLLDGSVHVSGRNVESYQLDAPAALAFEEMLQGSPLAVTISAVDRAISLALGRGEFLTMLSDNIALAQGLFRMLLHTPNARQWRTVYVPPQTESVTARSGPLQPLDNSAASASHLICARDGQPVARFGRHHARGAARGRQRPLHAKRRACPVSPGGREVRLTQMGAPRSLRARIRRSVWRKSWPACPSAGVRS